MPLHGDHVSTSQGDLIIHPINHATFLLGWSNLTIYADPVGGAGKYDQLPKADVILITHAHPDHLSVETLKAISTAKTVYVAPTVVADKLPADIKARTTVLKNGESREVSEVKVEAVPAYNTTQDRLQFHPKGVGNGYVLTLGGKRVYISGDTEDTPEIRGLKNIDVAFICMNLPYTMTVDQAASLVREFRPKIVYPYHYRGADLEKFKSAVGTDAGVEVRLRDWYRP